MFLHFLRYLFYLLVESQYRVTDSESFCPIWAKAGWCQKNSDLLQKCPHSCQKYGYMGANSLDERYITVNFQNTSSVRAPIFTEIVAPPPPSAAISAHSDLESVRNAFSCLLKFERKPKAWVLSVEQLAESWNKNNVNDEIPKKILTFLKRPSRRQQLMWMR